MNQPEARSQKPEVSRAALTTFFFWLLASGFWLHPLVAQDFQGATVSEIRFVTDAPFDTSELSSEISVKVGEPLSVRQVQSSVEALFNTGNFRDVVVDASRTGMDVIVTFRLSIHYRVADIDLEGFGGERQRAQREMAIRVGDVLSLDAIDRSAVAMQEILRRRGFLEAVVDPQTNFRRAENEATIQFIATLGPLARIGAIDLEGNLAPFTESELIQAMGRKVGSEYRASRARDDADKLERFLVNKGHRRADVRLVDAPYHAESDTVQVRYRVNVGPKVRVEVAGVERSRVRRWIPFRRNEGYSGDVIERARDRVIEELQKRGHFFATVDVTEEMQAGEMVITYKVEPGPQYKLDDIQFEGNATVSENRLEKVISSRPAGGFRSFLANLFRRPIGVTQDKLNDDAEALEAYYRLHGYTEADVKQPIARGNPDGTLDVTFPIVEGPQTLVDAVVVEGNEKIRANDLPELKLRPGDPLNPQVLREDLIALQTYYNDLGYAESVVSHQVEFTADKSGATVRYGVQEGPKVDVDEVIVEGNTYTETDVILRKSRLDKGDPYSLRSLLEAQRNLYRLGIFQRVELDDRIADTGVAERDVVISVAEGRNLTVGGSVAYSDFDGYGGSLSVSHRNLFGTARYAGVEAVYFTKRQRFALSYQEPFIFGYDIPVQVTIFQGEEERRPSPDSAPFANFRRLGTFVEATRVVGDQTQWSLRYEYRLVECVVQDPTRVPEDQNDLCNAATGVGEFPLEDFPLEAQEIQISSITPVFFFDKRNDPLNPSRGFFTSVAAEYAFPLFTAQTNFLKGFVQSAWYLPLTERSQLAFSGRLGTIEPLKPRDEPGGVVPYAERFLAGGENTHRAFETDSLGIFCDPDTPPPCEPTLIRTPDGDIVAVGGNGMALISAEYRFPIFGQLRGATFVDAGNVFADGDDIFDVNNFRYGAGFGLRYLTPVGPIRGDIGWKLDRKEGEEPYAAFLSLGYAF